MRCANFISKQVGDASFFLYLPHYYSNMTVNFTPKLIFLNLKNRDAFCS